MQGQLLMSLRLVSNTRQQKDKTILGISMHNYVETEFYYINNTNTQSIHVNTQSIHANTNSH